MTHIAKPILLIALKEKDCTIQAMVEKQDVIKSENCLNKMAICTFDYCSHSTEKKKKGKKKEFATSPLHTKTKTMKKAMQIHKIV